MRADDARERVATLVAEGASTDAILVEILAATAGPGECRVRDGRHDGEYPDVRPVMMSDGVHWCCSYDHCTVAVAPLQSGSE